MSEAHLLTRFKNNGVIVKLNLHGTPYLLSDKNGNKIEEVPEEIFNKWNTQGICKHRDDSLFSISFYANFYDYREAADE